MSKEKEIEYEGIICSLSERNAIVEILNKSACAACNAKGLCVASDVKKKHIEVIIEEGETFAAGERVNLVAQERMGLTAVLLAYVVPLVLMVAVLIGCNAAGIDDSKGGMMAIAVLIPYYIVLWLMRGRIRKQFVFRIKKQNNQI